MIASRTRRLARPVTPVPLICLALGLVAPHLQAQNVRDLYGRNCAGCHGEGYAGGSAPSLLDDSFATDGSDRALYDAIYAGMEDLGMPAFKGGLTEAQSWALVVYLREMRYDAQSDEREEVKADDQGVWRSKHEAFKVETLVEKIDDFERPWAIEFLPDARMLVTERSGKLYVFGRDMNPREVEGVPEVWQKGQGGMLDVGVHPDYAEPGNGWIYLAYSAENPDDDGKGNTVFVRGRIDFASMRWKDQQMIYRPDPKADNKAGVHFGSRFVFDGEGHVFVVVGERGQNMPAQSLDSPLGKIHRLNDDGTVPADNPFVDSETPTAWTIGHRNPQGLSMHPQTGMLYAVEHMPRGGDELNLIEKGGNYGWPVVAYAMNYNQTPYGDSAPWHEPRGFVEPLHYWIPSIAICGSTFYDGAAFPGWKNDLFVASLAKQELHRLRLSGDGRAVLEDELVFRSPGRIRDVAVAPDGSLVLALEQPGRLIRLSPAGE